MHPASEDDLLAYPAVNQMEKSLARPSYSQYPEAVW
jgi:hypothetical protein